MISYDLIISGAGISGLVSGIRAQQHGLKVLIVEKQKQFVETLRGEYIQPCGMRTLTKIGLAKDIQRVGTPVYCINYHFWPLTPFTEPKRIQFNYGNHEDFPDHAVAMPHLEFKDILLRKFLSVGGKVRMNSIISKFETNLDHSLTMNLVTQARTEILTCRHLAISEGVHSSLAKKINFKWNSDSLASSYMVGAVFEHDTVPEGRFVTAESKEGLLCAFKINPKLTRVYFYKDQISVEKNPFKKRRPESFLKSCVRTSAVASLFSDAQICSKVLAAPYVPRFATNPSLESVTLLGDAAGASHPLGGQGMSTAAADGILLADLLNEYTQGHSTLRNLNDNYNKNRLNRYLSTKFVSDWLSFIIGGTNSKSRTFRQLAVKIWSESPEGRRFCGQLFGGMITDPLQIKHLCNIWGIKLAENFFNGPPDVAKLFYTPVELDPRKLWTDITK